MSTPTPSSSSSSNKGKSKCRNCGEKILESGHYNVKILKGKRIPKKMEKLMKSGKLDEARRERLRGTKFGKFLLKRMENRANTVEITCGNCAVSTRIPARKPEISTPPLVDRIPSTSSSSSQFTPQQQPLVEGRKRKRNKDVNAGLTVPPSMLSSSRDLGLDDTRTMSLSSSSNNNMAMPSTPKKKKPIINKEKDMNNLKKVLSKMRKSKGNNAPVKGTSLKDFLSSM